MPTLLALMKVGYASGESFYGDNRFQHPYLGGLQGLCLAGSSAASALQELRQLTDCPIMALMAGCFSRHCYVWEKTGKRFEHCFLL